MLDEEEHLLAEKLKKSCDSNGKEVNITKSANFLHKLGLLYRERRHDKVSLIQSAALFNAALIRTSNNTVEIETDLKKLCKIILEEAEACNENANIINIAKIVKAMVKKMRMKTDSILQPVVRITEEFLEDEKFQAERHKINDIQSIQNEITETYSTIMDYVSNECSNIMGDPPEPCDFAVVGMGSIARKEVTPYSDFECVIVLETDAQKKTKYDGILEYFRWFTVIFQTILICLGETILPSVAIPSLNDFYGDGEDWFFDAYTKSGISFDGMMPHACKSPLGRQQNTKKKSWKTELIKPVDDMVKYLDSKENLKQGYHLADILTKTRFISGSKDVYENFNDKVKKKMSWQRTNNKEEQLFAINKQIEEDKKNLLVIDHMTNRIFSGKLNVKRTIYRSITIFIAALGGLYGIDFASCFDIIDALLYNQIISPDIAHKLKYAVSVACEIRLKIYMKKGRQSDLLCNIADQHANTELIEAVGEVSLIDQLTITCVLQSTISEKGISANIEFEFQMNSLYSSSICFSLGLYQTSIKLSKDLFYYMEIDFHEKPWDFLVQILILSTYFQYNKNEEALLALAKNFEDINFLSRGYQYAISCIDQFRKVFPGLSDISEKVLNEYENSLDAVSREERMGFCFQRAADGLIRLQVYYLSKMDEENTIDYVDGMMKTGKFNKVLEILKEIFFQHLIKDNTNKVSHIKFMVQIGKCLFKLEKYRESAINFLQARETSNDYNVHHICDFYIGRCLFKLKQYKESLPYLSRNALHVHSENHINDLIRFLDLYCCL